MNNKKRDYYDLPTEWLPSSNFANRPASEISEINTMDAMYLLSSSSSSSLSGAEDPPTLRGRSTHRPPDTPRTPAIRVTGPYEEFQRSRMKSVDEDVKIMDGPRLRKKSATAPPVGMSVKGYTLQLPQPRRRATSARQGELETIQGTDSQQETNVTNPLAVRQRLDHEQQGPQQQPQQSKRLPPRQSREGEQIVDSELTHSTRLSGSSSQNARVKKTLDDKNIGRLSIVDFETQGSLCSPRSMINTPREPYAIPEKQSKGWERSPLSKDASSLPAVEARRYILLNSSPLSPVFQQSLRTRPRKETGTKAHKGVRRPIYVPGPIRLEQHSAYLRKGSVATLDPFYEAGETQIKRYSDMIVLNSLTMFFADLSVVEEATEQCLDSFWRDTKPERRHVASHPKASITSIEEMRVSESTEKPQTRWSPLDSRFSFSSASSTSSMPPPGIPMRQRDKLKRLLSPAFVGSGK